MYRILVISNCDLCLEALEPLHKIGQVDYRPAAAIAAKGFIECLSSSLRDGVRLR